MFRVIEKIQNKSEADRRRAVVILATFITFIVFAIWLVSLTVRFSSVADEEKSSSVDDTSPIDALRGSFTDGFRSIQDQINTPSNE